MRNVPKSNAGRTKLAANIEDEAANYLAEKGYRHEIRWRGKFAVLYVLDTRDPEPQEFKPTSIFSLKAGPELARREIYTAVISHQFPNGHPEIAH